MYRPVAVLETTVDHQTLSDQISKLSDQFCHMVGHDVVALSLEDLVQQLDLLRTIFK